MIAIITDNRRIAKEIAHSLEIDLKKQDEGYYQGRGYMLVWTEDELISLVPTVEPNRKRLVSDDLPFIPQSFVLTPCKQQNGKGVLTDKLALQQLKVIKKVFDACQSIIVATEASERGELHFRRIYEYLNCDKPFKRVWLNSLTAKAIRESFQNLQESSRYDNLYAAADCREKANYLLNTNIDLAFAIAVGIKHYPPGRLQTPVLAMVDKRYFEHRNFKSSYFYEVRMALKKRGNIRKFKIKESIKNKHKANKIYEQLKTFEEAKITKVDIQMAVQLPPLLYNLSELQKDTHLRYGFSAKKTMEIARKLYEEKLISFPITDSRRIPKTVFIETLKNIRQPALYCDFADKLPLVEQEKPNRHSVGDVSYTEHHAIIPTGVRPTYLSNDDKSIYTLIVARTLEAFAPNCRKNTTHIEATCGNLVLTSKVSEVRHLGWRSILNREEDREEDEVREGSTVPMFAKRELVRITGWSLLTRKTQPQPLHTETSLLSAMEAFSLGTPETRTETIESLLSGKYIQRREQNLVPTEKGGFFYCCVEKMRIANAKLTGNWEKRLIGIGLGKQKANSFMKTFKVFTKQAADEILTL